MSAAVNRVIQVQFLVPSPHYKEQNMIFELWKSEDGSEYTFLPHWSIVKCPQLKKDSDDKDQIMIWSVEADTWDEACTKYHEYMGWEPYIPFDERCPVNK